jgi:hypothetical protein
LIFQRIYFHLLEKSLENENELIEHLSVYLNGFGELNSAYRSYPDAYLYMSFITNVGTFLTESIRIQQVNGEAKISQAEHESEHANGGQIKVEIVHTLAVGHRKLSRLLKCSINLYIHVVSKKSNAEFIEAISSELIQASSNLNLDNW